MSNPVKLFLFISVFLTPAIFCQECDPGFVYVEDVPSCCGAPAQHCFWEEDFNVLQEMIDNSAASINLEMDDNEDGIIQPVELGQTEWVAGRLVALDCFLSGIMSCHLSGPLPHNFGDLSELEFLWLDDNHLTGEIPESMGNLTNLELLYLSHNQFSGTLPQSLCNIDLDWGGENNWGVEYFTIEGNRLCPPLPDCLDTDIIGYQVCEEFMGDVNLDADVNILDIVYTVNVILEINPFTETADVNLDGSVNILDVVTLAQLILDLLEG
ncbi:MAG: dockerin type I domain-containing protein [Candidatus Marinimicrobia bacterium]|jgi:hypothetical protein|nr:dockerin type I domain-containing protein [Candidatus Neomarinimicrobiota bacterium]MDP6853174.1 dockerin type I domain-containing protein [Candidatus Neomarinimicrobiota bacterium]MDP6936905.1 dockerin type I domain-containing protein [Candidatus Neomarinimicrobiota bacterium]